MRIEKNNNLPAQHSFIQSQTNKSYQIIGNLLQTFSLSILGSYDDVGL
jgi:hypothetical protein